MPRRWPTVHFQLFPARVARMYRFCLVLCVCVCVCVSICAFVRPDPKSAFKRIQTAHSLENLSWVCWAWDPAMFVTTPWSLSVWRAGKTFSDGFGCLSGAFCPFNRLRSSPSNTAWACWQKSIPIPPAYPYPLPIPSAPAAAGCAIQPWADSSNIWSTVEPLLFKNRILKVSLKVTQDHRKLRNSTGHTSTLA